MSAVKGFAVRIVYLFSFQNMNPESEMKIKLKIVMAALITAMAGAPAQAGEWFVGAAVGASGIDEVVDLADSRTTLDEVTTSFRLFGGYQFNDYFGLEGGYVDFGNVGLDIASGIGAIAASASADGFTFAGIANVPIGERFSLHARLGSISWKAKTRFRITGTSISNELDGGTDAFFGLGAGVSLGEHWDLSADYERYHLEDITPGIFSLGLRYRFYGWGKQVQFGLGCKPG